MATSNQLEVTVDLTTLKETVAVVAVVLEAIETIHVAVVVLAQRLDEMKTP